jgi:hypothetical protein
VSGAAIFGCESKAITQKHASSGPRPGKSGGEWRADGNQTVIHGEAIDRKKGEKHPTAYKIINRAKSIEVPF